MKSEEQYKIIIQTAMDGFWLADTTGRILDVNETYCRMSGYTRDELLEMNIGELDVKESASELVSHMQKVIKQGSDRFESRHRRKDGTEYKVEISVQYRDVSGGRAVIFIRDITERKQAEEKLRESEFRWKFALEGAGDGVWDWNTKTNEVFFSPRWKAMLGYRENEIGDTLDEWEKRVHPDDKEQVDRDLADHLEGRTLEYRNEHRVLCKDGAWKWILDRGMVLARDQNGKPLRVIGTHSDITERKQAEKRLLEERNFNKTLVATAPAIILVLDEDGKIVHFNPYMEELTGYSIQEVQGRDWFDTFLPARDHDGIRRLFNTCLNDIPTKGNVNPILTKDGREVLIEWHDRTLKDEKGGINGVLVIGLNVTERSLAEEELRLKSLVIDQIKDHVTLTDLNGVITFVNQAQVAMFGKPREEMLGKKTEVYGEDTERGATQREIVEQTNLHGSWRGEVINYDAQGNERVMDCRTQIITDLEGNPIALGGFATDITERKNAEKNLKASEAKYRIVADNTYDWEFWRDPQGRYLYCSPSCKRITGHDADQFLNDPHRMPNIIHPHDKTLWEQLDARVAREHSRGEIEIRIIHANGTTRWIHHLCQPVFIDGAYSGVRGSIRDITRSKQAERDQQKLQQQLLQAQKMEAIGHLAGGVAHDFNNMLGIIMGSSQLALFDLDPDSEAHGEIKIILETSQRAKELTTKLLAFARKQEPKLKPASINDIVRDIQSMLERSVPKKIVIQTALREDIPRVMADENQIHQALLNICKNSADAMPHGGTLHITTREAENEHRCSRPDTQDECDRCCLIQITDTGIGIPDDIVNNIFDPFFTTKGIGKGTGLGLSVTHGIITSHGGCISVDSKSGAGTTITICLPFADGAGEAAPEDSQTEQLKGTETILIVDDEEMLLNSTSKLLSRRGFNILTAAGGRQAIEIFKEKRNQIDLVILDFIMPEMDAWDVFSELKRMNPDIRVLLASGYSEQGGISEVLSAGAKGFVQKPFDLDELCRNIRNTLDNE